jgi:type II secretory pathway component PulC
MDVTTQRRFLGAIASGLMVGAAGTVLWSLSGIAESNVAADPNRSQQMQPAIPEKSVQPLDDRVVAQSLRGPLYDPPPPTAPPLVPRRESASPSRSQLDLTLVGTIIESDQSLAILADSSGKFDVKGIGESLELSPQGVTLQGIESEQVTIQYQGRKSTVRLDRSLKKPAGGDGKRNNRRRNQ